MVKVPDEVRAAALKEVDRLVQMPAMAPEVGIIRTYLDWILELPWSQATEDNLDVVHAASIFDQYHYGLGKAKDRILEYIAVRSLKPKRQKQPILCFVGAPGTGKTSLGRSIAEALGRNFVRVSLGGVRDEAEIRGHRRTYIGALPGRILQTMKRAGTINPLFMLDEIDKLGADFRGDHQRHCLRCLIRSKTTPFRIIIWSWRMIFPKLCSSPLQIRLERFRRLFLTAWKQSNSQAISKRRSLKLPGVS